MHTYRILFCFAMLHVAALATNAKVYVALYHPSHPKDPSHWAIYIDDPTSGPTIHQVYDDGTKYYVPEVVVTKPERSSQLDHLCLFGEIESHNVKLARDTIQAQRCDNTSGRWNCQAWVQEALQSVDHKGLIKLDSHAEKCLKYARQHWQK